MNFSDMESKREKWLWNNDKDNAHALEVGNNGKASTISKKVRLETTIENAKFVQFPGYSIAALCRLSI